MGSPVHVLVLGPLTSLCSLWCLGAWSWLHGRQTPARQESVGLWNHLGNWELTFFNSVILTTTIMLLALGSDFFFTFLVMIVLHASPVDTRPTFTPLCFPQLVNLTNVDIVAEAISSEAL